MSTIQDPLERRAHDAGRAAVMAVAGTRIDVQSVAGRGGSRGLRLAVVAAGLVLVVVAGLVVVRVVGHRDQGLPAFEPRPVPGATTFRPALQPGLHIRVPTNRFVVQNTPSLLRLNFTDLPAGGLLAFRVRSYPDHNGQDLVHDIAVDPRVHVVSTKRATVGGEPATRMVLRPRKGITETDWICPAGGARCMTINATGGNTVYVFRHDGHRYVLVGGAVNDTETRRLRAIVDGAAATWRW